MQYVYPLPAEKSFEGKGLFGYTFKPLRQKDLEIYYIEVEKGHDTFMISKKITRTYYVIGGSGYFTIADRRYDVGPGMLVEVPPKLEYCYSGQMKLIAFSRPRWFDGNDTHTKWNPDVAVRDFPCTADVGSWLTRLVRLRIFGKSPIGACLRLHRRLWSKLPASLSTLGPIRSYGDFLHMLARMQGARGQAFSTFFLRNRPQLELIRHLAERKGRAGTLRVAVLGCSTGAEAYSVAWRIRSAHPDLKLILHAVDISRQALEIGKRGTYPLSAPQVTDRNIFDRMTAEEINELFDTRRGTLAVKSWVKEGIEWHVGDARDSDLVDMLGPQDIVVANNFLCHMDAMTAEKGLRNIARLVNPYGYLFVSGIDLDVRTKVAADLGWQPLQELLEEIHEGDPCMKSYWPWHYAGLEPLNKKRQDWRLRYAAAFQLAPAASVQDLERTGLMGEDMCSSPVKAGASAGTPLKHEPARPPMRIGAER